MNQISCKQFCWSSKRKPQVLWCLEISRATGFLMLLLLLLLLFKATPCCFFMATIVSTKTMTSLRLRAYFKLHIFKLKSLQLYRVKFSRKSYPRVGKGFVLNNPLYNLKISDYIWRNSMIKGLFTWSGDPGLVGLVSFVFTLWGTQNKRNLPH